MGFEVKSPFGRWSRSHALVALERFCKELDPATRALVKCETVEIRGFGQNEIFVAAPVYALGEICMVFNRQLCADTDIWKDEENLYARKQQSPARKKMNSRLWNRREFLNEHAKYARTKSASFACTFEIAWAPDCKIIATDAKTKLEKIVCSTEENVESVEWTEHICTVFTNITISSIAEEFITWGIARARTRRRRGSAN